MFRILIVEDEIGTFERLAKRIPRKIPEARVEIASTVSEARNLLRDARTKREPYDAVVLDIMLPEDVGEPAEMDETLCDEIKKTMPASIIVAHISAFLDDQDVQQHMKQKHDEQIDRSFRLSKASSEWFLELEKKLTSFLYGTRIESRLDQLFGEDDEPAFAARNRLGRLQPSDDRSLTHRLSALSREISAHWPELDHGLQARIKRTFQITEKDKKVIVSFF